MADWAEGARIGMELGSQLGGSVGRYYEGKWKGMELRERMKERHDAVEAAAAEKHHELNKEAAEASRQTEQDYVGKQEKEDALSERKREFDLLLPSKKEAAHAKAVTADKAGGKASDPHYRFVKDSLDRASKDVSAWMSAHPGMTPPPDLINHAKAAKKDHDTYGKAMGYDVTDVPDLPEVVPVQKPGLFRQGLNAVEGMFSPAPARSEPRYDIIRNETQKSAPGQGWRDYQK